MKKFILYIFLFLLIPYSCFTLDIPTPKVGLSTRITFKENLFNAAKKFAAFSFKNKAIHGAAIGAVITLILEALIRPAFEEKTNSLLSLIKHEPKPPTSIFFILISACYGAYLTTQPFNSYSVFAIDNLIADLVLAVAYLIWRLILENTSEEAIKCSIKNNLIGTFKQFCMHLSASLLSYISTKQLEKMDY